MQLFSPSFSSSCFPSSLGASPFTRGRKGLGTQTTSHQCILSTIFLSIWRLFHWGARGGGRTLFRRVGRISLIDGVPPDVYFTSPGRDSKGDAIRHDTGTALPLLLILPFVGHPRIQVSTSVALFSSIAHLLIITTPYTIVPALPPFIASSLPCSTLPYSALLCSPLPLPFPALLCSALLCPGSPLPCPILLCSALLCPALPCPALPCPTLLCSALPCSPLPCPTLPCPTLLCPALLCSALPCSAHACSAPTSPSSCPSLPNRLLPWLAVPLAALAYSNIPAALRLAHLHLDYTM